MLDTALCYFTGFVAICFGDKANKHSLQSQENQAKEVVREKSPAWGFDD